MKLLKILIIFAMTCNASYALGQWECISTQGHTRMFMSTDKCYLQRLPIHNGWLVESLRSGTLTFVYDKTHQWKE